MNDKELADRVVALGVAHKITMPEPHSGCAYQFPVGEPDNGWLFLTESSLVRDWRIAGAVMEKAMGREYVMFVNPDKVVFVFTDREPPWDDCEEKCESLPRAIIEACCEALE